MIINVAIPIYIDKSFYYKVPKTLEKDALIGKRVLVPFGRRTLTGYIIENENLSLKDELKEILQILDEKPLWTKKQFEFLLWISNYYFYPIGEVIKASLPNGINLKSKKGEPDTIIGGQKFKKILHYMFKKDTTEHISEKTATILKTIKEEKEVSSINLKSRFGNCTSQLNKLLSLDSIFKEEREIYRDPLNLLEIKKDEEKILNNDQKNALEEIKKGINSNNFSPYLLHGVTGSGKTEVYLQSIKYCLSKNNQSRPTGWLFC